MDNVRHTQGLWKVDEYGGRVNIEADGEWIATMSATKNNKENARLIAAAPELLDALADILFKSPIEDTERLDGTHEIKLVVSEAMIKKAKTAIKKAEGDK